MPPDRFRQIEELFHSVQEASGDMRAALLDRADPELRREVLIVMRQLAVEGMTMLVVTHEMGFAREVGTRIVFMDHGEIVEEAAPQMFFTAPKTDRAQRFLSQLID